MADKCRPARDREGFPVLPTAQQCFQHFCSQQLQQTGLPLSLLRFFDFTDHRSAQKSLALCLATLEEAAQLIAGTSPRVPREAPPW